jgi:hypothetical protein
VADCRVVACTAADTVVARVLNVGMWAAGMQIAGAEIAEVAGLAQYQLGSQ